jgi:HSP20 family protein
MIVRHRVPTTFDRTFDRTLDRTFDRGLDRTFDRAFEQLTSSFFDTRRSAGPVTDGAWKDDQYVLTVDLPGVPAEAVSVEVTGDQLVLEARTDEMQWQRSLRLGGRLDPEKVSAHHVDGRLTVRIGTHDEPEARKIAIATTPPQAAIEAESSVADDAQPADTGDANSAG